MVLWASCVADPDPGVQLDDPAIFPHEYGVPFPANFMAVVKIIFKRLFRVYAHIYHSHFKHVCSLGAEAHLNTCFRHFIAFSQVHIFVVHYFLLSRSCCQFCIRQLVFQWTHPDEL